MINLYENEIRAPKSKSNANTVSTANVTALYERLSCEDGPEGESNSITNQKAFLEDYAAKNGFTNCRHYTDDGYSGANFDRPGWQQMIADIEAGTVKTVLVKDISRAGRNYVETGYYTEIYFAQMTVRFIAVNNGFDNADPDSTQFTGFVNVMNDWYRKDIARKISLAMEQKGKSGKPLATHPCFGYKKDPADKNKWIIDPEAAETVRRIFELAASGISQLKICRTLVREKYVTPGFYRAQHDPEGFGKQFATARPDHWRGNAVAVIVRRREYLGETVNFKTCPAKFPKHGVPAAPEAQMIFPGTHEAIVDHETWQKAQRIFHPEMTNVPGKPCVFTGLVICGECGRAMQYLRNSGHGESGYYICSTYKKSASYAERLCVSNKICVSVIAQIVKEVIQTVSHYAITDEAAFRRELIKESKASKPENIKQLMKLKHEKEKRAAELEHLMKKLYEDYALGHITEERFEKLSVSYEQEEDEIKRRLSEIETRINNTHSEEERAEQFLALARKYRDCTEVTDEMIRAFIEKIVVYKTLCTESGRTRNIEVHLNFIGNFSIPAEGMNHES